ncbi:MAG: hypothetical protein ACFHWZ_11110 [Phycisphaerales bacterium]|nr:hypothetical protein [bacterium]
MVTRRFKELLRRIVLPEARRRDAIARDPPPVRTRDATEHEIDEAIDESFPASDPPALHFEKQR